jgi:hypothetical protein
MAVAATAMSARRGARRRGAAHVMMMFAMACFTRDAGCEV